MPIGYHRGWDLPRSGARLMAVDNKNWGTYRKKTNILAVRVEDQDKARIVKQSLPKDRKELFYTAPDHCLVRTLEGDIRGNYPFWLAVGAKGELYPIKEDIFLETYELI